MNSILKILKSIFITPTLSWSGNYKDWSSALKSIDGYGDKLIFDSIKIAHQKAKDDANLYERDGFLIRKTELNLALLYLLAELKDGRSDKRIRIVDFGGGLASVYEQHAEWLTQFKSLEWNIVEQKPIVELGRGRYKDEVSFYNSVKELGERTMDVDLVLLSSVIQYLRDPKRMFSELLKLKPTWIFIDLTPFSDSDEKIVVQRIHKRAYGKGVSYPMWLLNLADIQHLYHDEYKTILMQDASHGIVKVDNVKYPYKTIILKRR